MPRDFAKERYFSPNLRTITQPSTPPQLINSLISREEIKGMQSAFSDRDQISVITGKKT